MPDEARREDEAIAAGYVRRDDETRYGGDFTPPALREI